MRAPARRVLTLAAALALLGPGAAWTADDKPKGEHPPAEPPADKARMRSPRSRPPS